MKCFYGVMKPVHPTSGSCKYEKYCTKYKKFCNKQCEKDKASKLRSEMCRGDTK